MARVAGLHAVHAHVNERQERAVCRPMPGMCNQRHTPGRVDGLYPLGGRGRREGNMGRGGIAQKPVECVRQIHGVASRHEGRCHVGPCDHCLCPGPDILPGNRRPELAQSVHHGARPILPKGRIPRGERGDRRMGRVDSQSQKVRLLPPHLHTGLNSPDEGNPERTRCDRRLGIPGCGVMVGDGQFGNSPLAGQMNKSRWREQAVRGRGVRMQFSQWVSGVDGSETRNVMLPPGVVFHKASAVYLPHAVNDPMERLWSPWRAEHVARWASSPGARDQSVFERLAGEDNDPQNLILWRGSLWYVVLNLYPYNNGHSLIVPFRKVSRYTELTTQEQIELSGTIDRVIRWTESALGPDGFNVGMNQGEAAGAGIPDHLHVHVVPRWISDTNFMPTTGQIKVIPEALRTTYDRLRMEIGRDTP